MAAILSLKRFASFNVTKHKRMYKVNDADLFVTKFKPNRLQIDHFHKNKKISFFSYLEQKYSLPTGLKLCGNNVNQFLPSG